METFLLFIYPFGMFILGWSMCYLTQIKSQKKHLIKELEELRNEIDKHKRYIEDYGERQNANFK